MNFKTEKTKGCVASSTPDISATSKEKSPLKVRFVNARNLQETTE